MVVYRRAGIILLAASLVASVVAARPRTVAADVGTIGSVSAQLGVKVAGRNDAEFQVGVQFQGLLEDPLKLSVYGIDGMHFGARVVAVRLSPTVVYVEADQIDPAKRANVRLGIGDDGKLIVPKPVTP